MLRIIQNQHVAGAKSYYSTADYYTEGQELAGRWRGNGAKLLGLSGIVKQEQWDAMCDHLDPNTGEKLFQRRKDNRTVGYDINWHAPKSVSLAYGLTKDDRILDAFRQAVDATMNDIEAEIQTRVRKGGKNEDRVTGNLVWGEFVHLTSRPVDGIPDPHLHAHCFAFNLTKDAEENAWKAAQFRDAKRDAPYHEAMFHVRLAENLSKIGLPIERNKNGWEIAGFSQETLRRFSRRTAQIKAEAKAKGIDDPALKAELGAKTRSRKVKDLTFGELQEEWRSRLPLGERDAIARALGRIGGKLRLIEPHAAAKSVDHAIAHAFERASCISERRLFATALKHAAGHASADSVLREFASRRLLTHEKNGVRMVTTPEVLAEEQRIINFARSGRGTCRPLGSADHVMKRQWLNASQQAAVRYVLASRDRVIAIRGAAGVGKSTLMQEAVEAIEAGGTKVLAFAPTADASRSELRKAGFKDADTVARLLKDAAIQRKAHGQVLWIDEAGLLGAKTTAELFNLAERIGARVILSGDRRQHFSIERGAVLRLLEEEAGVKPAEVKEIQRQSGAYKAAIRAMSDGRVTEGFDRLDALGWIKEIPGDERYKQLAADYVDTVASGKSALVISPTHREKDHINDEIRRLLKERGMLGKDERSFLQLQNTQFTEAERRDAANYLPGDVIQFHQNAKGYRRGQRIKAGNAPLPLDQANRFSVYRAGTLALAPGDTIRITQNGTTADGKHQLHNGTIYRVKGLTDDGSIVLANGWRVPKDFGHLAYGTVLTSHASQGKTVDRVFIGQSAESHAASSREQFYVSCSRGREAATIYCDDKRTLREAVSHSDERLTATELNDGHRRRMMAAERDAMRQQEQTHVREKELAHARR
jgi:conjugative relaxase-like TrwC/TraI family protein